MVKRIIPGYGEEFLRREGLKLEIAAWADGLRFHFDEVVTEWIEPERLAVRALSSWDMEAVGVLSSERGGTRLTYTVRYRPSGKWGWLIPGWLVWLGSQHMLAEIRRTVR